MILTGAAIQTGHEMGDATVIACDGQLYPVAKLRMSKGRFISRFDGVQSFAVLGAVVAENISRISGRRIESRISGRRIELGDRVALNGGMFSIVGILEPIQTNQLLGVDFDRAVTIPIKSARRVTSNSQISLVAAVLETAANDEAAAQKITNYFGRYRPKPYTVTIQTAHQLIVGVDAQMKVYGLLLLAIGSVSLVVGGFGIMNVMLMSIMERRQEIGLRMALGATRVKIRSMFLLESLVLSAAGCTSGSLIGYMVGVIFTQWSGWRFQSAPMTTPIAVAMTFIVGMFFGYYTANRAARLDPIAALRG